jgi:hypothetical protein
MPLISAGAAKDTGAMQVSTERSSPGFRCGTQRFRWRRNVLNQLGVYVAGIGQ